MSAEIHLGDIGTVFRGTIVDENGTAVDVSTAGTLQMYFKPPVGAKLTKTASLNTDGVDGKIKYVTVSSDINETGEWQVQGHVIFSDGRENYSVIRKFTVKGNL